MSENSTYTDTTTENVDNGEVNSDGELRFVIVPLIVIVGVMLLTIMVCLMARKRKLDNLRHRLMPLYNFDKTEQESDWETEFLNSVDNPNYTDYTTNFTRYED